MTAPNVPSIRRNHDEDEEDFAVATVKEDNLSRGNMGAVKILQQLFPEPGRLQFIYADLGDAKAVNKIFAENAFDAVMHFAAVAYVGESTAEPLRLSEHFTLNDPKLDELKKLQEKKDKLDLV